jgi:ABC-2 type transport system ATP-binding protein
LRLSRDRRHDTVSARLRNGDSLPILDIQRANKAFGGTRALDGASLELRQGEWLGLLGPNGAGKTTLVRAIAGRVRLDGGQVRLFGCALDGSAAGSAARRRLGIVPQDFAIYPRLTAAENLWTFGRLLGLRGSQLAERVRWALSWIGLEDRANDVSIGFSGGMKRRLNLGCGVLHRPEVILLDEPTAGVDPQSRQRIWEMLDELRRDGASLVLTTHQLDEAQSVCDRIVILDHGRDIAAGTLSELIRETVGSDRRVTLVLDRTPDAALTLAGVQIDGKALSCRVADVATELQSLLKRVHDSGLGIEDVRVEAPSLQAVFLHLTGRELRE